MTYSEIALSEMTTEQKEAIAAKVEKRHTGKYASKIRVNTIGDFVQFGKVFSGERANSRRLQGKSGAYYVQHKGDKRAVGVVSAYFDQDGKVVHMTWEME